MYCSKDEEFDDPPSKACNIGNLVKKSNKLKSKSKKVDSINKPVDVPPDYLPISSKLRTLDVFAGCGGKYNTTLKFNYFLNLTNTYFSTTVRIINQLLIKIKNNQHLKYLTGLSEGLKEAGISESKWAIEVDDAAAHAYRINNPNSAVFTGDCNMFLKKVMNVCILILCFH